MHSYGHWQLPLTKLTQTNASVCRSSLRHFATPLRIKQRAKRCAYVCVHMWLCVTVGLPRTPNPRRSITRHAPATFSIEQFTGSVDLSRAAGWNLRAHSACSCSKHTATVPQTTSALVCACNRSVLTAAKEGSMANVAFSTRRYICGVMEIAFVFVEVFVSANPGLVLVIFKTLKGGNFRKGA